MIRAGPWACLLERSVKEGENPVHTKDDRVHCGLLSKSRVVWECSSNWVVNSI